MRVYIDTSVVGGCFDDEFKEWSNALFDEFILGIKQVVVSDLLYREIELARKEVSDKLSEIPKNYVTLISTTDEAIALAETYINEGALTNKSFNDALHIALTTLSYADVLVSWNFKHIVNLDRIRLYNSVNLKLGYRVIEIRSPREVLN